VSGEGFKKSATSAHQPTIVLPAGVGGGLGGVAALLLRSLGGAGGGQARRGSGSSAGGGGCGVIGGGGGGGGPCALRGCVRLCGALGPLQGVLLQVSAHTQI